MCRSMADIQSTAAEIRRGKKEEDRRRRRRKKLQGKNIMAPLLHRAAIIMRNRKSYMGFPTSYRWSAYVTSKSPKEWLKKRTFPFSGTKVNFSWMKSASKFLWEKTSSGRVVVHSFPYRMVHRCWGKHYPFNLKCSVKVTNHLTKRWIGDISACSSSAVTAS